ncbi:MAG: hypothetical protein JRJ14_10390 [Deltaproteobacteria bacterium]|nr:hypothetical protein [Deltaproteobacteria bacterium]
MDLVITNETEEILARIVKATARKYDCNIEIGRDPAGRLSTKFTGEEFLIPHIAMEVVDRFLNIGCRQKVKL